MALRAPRSKGEVSFTVSIETGEGAKVQGGCGDFRIMESYSICDRPEGHALIECLCGSPP